MVRDWFKCKHPFKAVIVEKQETQETKDAFFDKVTYHLYCRKCGESLKLTYAKLKTISAEDFLKRMS
jgi:Fe2+ or Zn2+ uptake regulation protein